MLDLKVLQRIADVSSMCEKRLSSLQILVAKKPVQTVTPEPGVPLQPAQNAPVLIKPKIFRKANTVAKVWDTLQDVVVIVCRILGTRDWYLRYHK